MCLAIPGQIKEILRAENYAIADFDGVKTKINIELIKPKIGDWIMVHAGFAIEIIDEEDATETLKLFK